MRKLATVSLAGIALLMATAANALDAPNLGAARQHSIDESGITGTILLLDTGNDTDGLILSGRATGLDPGATYVTLVYDAASVPAGPVACLPANFSLTSTQMFVNMWQVEADGTGTLFAKKTGDSYAALERIGAVSIRDVQGPIPQGAILVACGRVHRVGD